MKKVDSILGGRRRRKGRRENGEENEGRKMKRRKKEEELSVVWIVGFFTAAISISVILAVICLFLQKINLSTF